ncbi:MAG: S46 family peptidase [Pyrinomonadaceae bacterium]|nr:S46 family peptidase [Pyrinomonadaceae bacterium]
MIVQKSRLVAAVLSLILFVSVVPINLVRAEEGMFTPDKIAGLPLKQKGINISASEIYNPTTGGLTEAVVRINIGQGGGGTGEFVSNNGLILTNHHVAYDALVSASTVDKNYGVDGFKADSPANEMQAKDFSILITQKVDDVTAQVKAGIADTLTDEQRADAIAKKIQQLTTEAKAAAPKNSSITIQAIDDGYFYYKYQTLTIRDIRVVYAPPYSIGQFGGDPDNFEYPRHGGDFTFLRAYVAPDGSSAEYSPNNVPYKPRKSLTINAGGSKENDAIFVVGYPGGTTRYRESFSVAYNQDVQLPFIVDYFREQVAAYTEAGKSNPAKRVKYQGDIFNYLNTIKAEEGGVLALRRGNVVATKQADEARFTQWLNADATRKAKYGEVLPNLQRAYGSAIAPSQKSALFRFFGNGEANWQLVLLAARIAIEKEKPQAERNARLIAASAQVKAGLTEILASREPVLDRAKLAFFLRRANELPTNQKVAAFEKQFGTLKDDERNRAQDDFVRTFTEDKRFTTAESLSGLFDMTVAQMRALNSPEITTMLDVTPEIEKVQTDNIAFNQIVTKNRPLLIQGMSEMKNVTPYPDANFTQRFTYGTIKGYKPKESLVATPFTTLDGVLEKDTGREPFNVPQKLKQLAQTKNFGAFGENGTVVVNSISTADIIGGNSGSPLLNANGEQIALVFDGNYEGLGNDFFVSETLGRTISVDIRYVLFITEKYGDAGWILKEMNIKNK